MLESCLCDAFDRKVFEVKPSVWVQLGHIFGLTFIYSTPVKNVINFGFFLHIVNCLSVWLTLSGGWKLFILIHYAATCQTIIWNCYVVILRFCWRSSVCLSVNSICSWSNVILMALALWPLLYQNLLIMSFKVSYSHDYFGSTWLVRCILWLKSGLWPWELGIHVTC